MLCEMFQRKLLKISAGALFILLPWFGGLVFGELSANFSNCSKFFYNGTAPEGIETGKRYQPICQYYNEDYHFATLYDREHRIPLYSAYILKTPDRIRPNDPWKYEPQLANPKARREMVLLKHLNETEIKKVMKSQAVNGDYNHSGYTRGHLNPSNHQETKDNREATFTLTNIVPQNASSNGGPWKSLENIVLNNSKDFCNGPMFVITGVLPYESGTRWIKEDRVSIPEYLWSAYCCPNYTSNTERTFFPTYAAVGRNDRNSGNEIVPVNEDEKPTVRGYHVERMTLENLEKILKERLKMPAINLFDGKCRTKK